MKNQFVFIVFLNYLLKFNDDALIKRFLRTFTNVDKSYNEILFEE